MHICANGYPTKALSYLKALHNLDSTLAVLVSSPSPNPMDIHFWCVLETSTYKWTHMLGVYCSQQPSNRYTIDDTCPQARIYLSTGSLDVISVLMWTVFGSDDLSLSRFTLAATLLLPLAAWYHLWNTKVKTWSYIPTGNISYYCPTLNNRWEH